MKKLFKLVLGVTLLMGAPAFAVVMQYLDANNQPVNVSGAEPMPVNAEVTVGSITASLSGDVRVTGQTCSSLTVHVDNVPATQAVTVGNFPATQTISGSVSVSNQPTVNQGLALEQIQQVATASSLSLTTVTSGTATPFWASIRNTGSTNVYISNGTPTSYSDAIATGEQIVLYLGTNTPTLNFNGVSAVGTLTFDLWK